MMFVNKLPCLCKVFSMGLVFQLNSNVAPISSCQPSLLLCRSVSAEKGDQGQGSELRRDAASLCLTEFLGSIDLSEEKIWTACCSLLVCEFNHSSVREAVALLEADHLTRKNFTPCHTSFLYVFHHL